MVTKQREQSKYSTKVLDHLDLVAGMCQELKISELIDGEIPNTSPLALHINFKLKNRIRLFFTNSLKRLFSILNSYKAPSLNHPLSERVIL